MNVWTILVKTLADAKMNSAGIFISVTVALDITEETANLHANKEPAKMTGYVQSLTTKTNNLGGTVPVQRISMRNCAPLLYEWIIDVILYNL